MSPPKWPNTFLIDASLKKSMEGSVLNDTKEKNDQKFQIFSDESWHSPYKVELSCSCFLENHFLGQSSWQIIDDGEAVKITNLNKWGENVRALRLLSTAKQQKKTAFVGRV